MAIQATPPLVSSLSALKTRYNHYIITLTGRKNTNIHGIAYRLYRRCKTTHGLRHFSQQADDLQDEIEHVLDTENNMKQIRTIIASYVTYYSDKESWEEDYGSMEGWEEYMEGLEHPEAEGAEIMLVRRKLALAKQLGSLLEEVKAAGIKKMQRGKRKDSADEQ